MYEQLTFEAEPFAFEADPEAADFEAEYPEQFETPSPGSVIHPRIDVFAQYALQRMLKGDAAARSDAAGMLAAVRGEKLRGIFKEDEQEPALRAKRMNKGWWEVIPKGQDAVLFLEPSNPFGAPPMIDFRDGVRSNPARLDPALRAAWRSFTLLRAGQLVPCAGGTIQAEAGVPGAPAPNVVPPLLCEKPTGVIIPTGFGGGDVIPVIVVPGVMGTRLVEPSNGEMVWNPPRSLTSSAAFGPTATNFDRLVRVLQPLDPAPNSDIPPNSLREAAAAIPNFGNLIFDYYGNIMLELNSIAFTREMLAATGRRVQVYACGYDWRQDNADSARRLASVVDRALAETQAEQCVVVAHSMGGLVTRYYCRTGGESKVGLLILLGSPTHGAPEAYKKLKRGDSIFDHDIAWHPFWPRAVQMRALPSLYQLLPTKIFCEKNPDWLQFNSEATRVSPFLPPLTNASDPDKVYANPYTGFTERLLNDDENVQGLVPANLARRAAFDKRLGDYMPKPTHVLFAACLPTDKQYRLSLAGTVFGVTTVAENGDGRVPPFSARADGCDLGTGKRIEVSPCAEHSLIPNDPNVISTIKLLIRKAVPKIAETSSIIRRAKGRSAPAGRPAGVLRLPGKR